MDITQASSRERGAVLKAKEIDFSQNMGKIWNG
jgi:hypothetical protein